MIEQKRETNTYVLHADATNMENNKTGFLHTGSSAAAAAAAAAASAMGGPPAGPDLTAHQLQQLYLCSLLLGRKK